MQSMHEVGEWSTLCCRDISRNNISGSLPTEIWGMSQLFRLYGFLSAAFHAPVRPGARRERLPWWLLRMRACMKEASRAHSSSPGRSADRTSISGSLPTEIGRLSSLTRLYSRLSAVFWALRQKRAPYKLCTKGAIGAHSLVLAGMSTRQASQGRSQLRSGG